MRCRESGDSSWAVSIDGPSLAHRPDHFLLRLAGKLLRSLDERCKAGVWDEVIRLGRFLSTAVKSGVLYGTQRPGLI